MPQSWPQNLLLIIIIKIFLGKFFLGIQTGWWFWCLRMMRRALDMWMPVKRQVSIVLCWAFCVISVLLFLLLLSKQSQIELRPAIPKVKQKFFISFVFFSFWKFYSLFWILEFYLIWFLRKRFYWELFSLI